MASQEWSFSSYFANLAQNAPTDDKKQYNFGYDHNVDDQRVFAELKPPCSNDLILGGANDHYKEGMVHFGTSNSVADAFVPNIFRSQSIKSELSTNTDNLENVIEQQLVSWDLNRLVALGNDAIIGGVVDDDLQMLKSEEDWDVDCENAMQFLSQPNINAQLKREGDIAQDEFQFPQCVEEQFRQLILRANEHEERQCTKCGGIAPRRDENQTLYIRNEKKAKDDSNTETESKATEHLIVNCKSELNDEIDNGSNDFVNSSYFPTSNSKEQSINAPEDKSLLPKETLKKVTHNSEVEAKIGDIDKVLTHIDPDLDVLGKTFHKIPSTQPIYCDEEPRDDENGNDNRIKRPMNAFMLWARKYRSLVAKEFSEASNSEISVKLGEIWNELTSDQQRPYFKKAESLKTQHKQSYPNYVYQPRQATTKVTRKTKSALNGKDNKVAFPALPANFGSPFAFFCNTKTQGLEEVGENQDIGREQTKNIIMTPKPIYPVGYCNQRADGKAKPNTDNKTTENFNLLEKKNTVGKQRDLPEDNNGIVKNADFGSNSKGQDTGLVKDAMMPRFEKPGDETDLPTSDFAALNTTAFDEFLSGGSKNLSEYLDCCLKKHGQEENDASIVSKCGKRKRRDLKSNVRKRKKSGKKN